MSDAELLNYLHYVHGMKRSLAWLRRCRRDGNGPLFWRDGLVARTDQADADAFAEHAKGPKFRSTADGRSWLASGKRLVTFASA